MPKRKHDVLHRTLCDIRYQKLETYDNLCIYCGEPGDGYDHSPAIARLAVQELLRPEVPLLAVRCCRRCNGMLGATNFFTLRERAVGLYQRYCKKVKLISWSEEEIRELGYTLQTRVLASQRTDVYLGGIFAYLWARQRMLLLWEEDGANVKALETLLLRPLSIKIPQPRVKKVDRSRKSA